MRKDFKNEQEKRKCVWERDLELPQLIIEGVQLLWAAKAMWGKAKMLSGLQNGVFEAESVRGLLYTRTCW